MYVHVGSDRQGACQPPGLRQYEAQLCGAGPEPILAAGGGGDAGVQPPRRARDRQGQRLR